jgi:hypothetical protein
MQVFPYIAQPAGGGSAAGCAVKRERSTLSGQTRSRGRRNVLDCFVVRVLTEKSHLDDLDDLCGSLLDGVHQARNNRCATFLSRIACYVGERITAGVEADRRAGDKGGALGDRLALCAIVGLPDRRRQRMRQLVNDHVQHALRSGSLHANRLLLVVAASFGLVVLGVRNLAVAD